MISQVHGIPCVENIGEVKVANCEPFLNFLFANYFHFRNTGEYFMNI